MRIVFLILLAANLLFLAWAAWIDGPRDTGAHDALSHLPRLQLIGEPDAPKPAAANSSAQAPAAQSTAASSAPLPETEPATANVSAALPETQPGTANVPAASPGTQLAAASPAMTPAAVATMPAQSTSSTAEKVALQLPSSPPRCTSVGPFNDIAHAARAAGLLTQRGFKLQQRAEEGETIEGYWVYVGDLSSDQDVSDVVARLEKNGFTDAHVMKNFSTNRRISVGMFSTRERADKRAAAVKAMGLSPEVAERKFPGTIYWVDVALASPSQKPPPEYLFADIGHARVAMQPCPVGLTPGNQADPDSQPRDELDGQPRVLPRTAVASSPPAR